MKIPNTTLEGLNILSKYDDFSISAEHDIVYSSVPCDAVSEEDKKKLEELHWHDEEDHWAKYV